MAISSFADLDTEKLFEDKTISINDKWRVCFEWREGNAYNGHSAYPLK